MGANSPHYTNTRSYMQKLKWLKNGDVFYASNNEAHRLIEEGKACLSQFYQDKMMRPVRKYKKRKYKTK